MESEAAAFREYYLRELRVRLPRLQQFALDVVNRRASDLVLAKEDTARKVLADIPKQEIEAEAALLILDHGEDGILGRFLIGDHNQRLAAIGKVIRDCGLYDLDGRWRPL